MRERFRPDAIRVVPTRRGLRLYQSGDLLSELLDRPGPTHDLFDLIAAAIRAGAPGKRVVLLGLAAGGVVAPLRAMGWEGPLVAVDRSPEATRLFREHAGAWTGPVRVHHADAAAWLDGDRRRWDVIVDDLSIPARGGSTKPSISLERLPGLAARRLTARGIYVVNWLPRPDEAWTRSRERLLAVFPHGVALRLDGWENRVLALSRRPLDARRTGRAVRSELAAIGSRCALRLAARRLDACR